MTLKKDDLEFVADCHIIKGSGPDCALVQKMDGTLELFVAARQYYDQNMCNEVLAHYVQLEVLHQHTIKEAGK
jgi:hypothetical protein